MKALAIISEQYNSKTCQWQFDKVMVAIAYDLDLSVVFINKGIEQIHLNKAWICLELYGVESVFQLTTNNQTHGALFKATNMDNQQLKDLISQADLIL